MNAIKFNQACLICGYLHYFTLVTTKQQNRKAVAGIQVFVYSSPLCIHIRAPLHSLLPQIPPQRKRIYYLFLLQNICVDVHFI